MVIKFQIYTKLDKRHVFVKHGCPRRLQSQNMAKISKSYILTPPNPQGHVMSVKCEEPITELTVQVCLLYHHPNLKGHRHDWWCLFTISFFPKLLYISSMKPSQNRATIFKRIVHGIELHAAFEERENKQTNAKGENSVTHDIGPINSDFS